MRPATIASLEVDGLEPARLFVVALLRFVLNSMVPLPSVARWLVKLCLLVLASLYAPVDNASAQGSVALDRAALEALYNATGGPSWTVNTNWLTDAPLSHWAGVGVDGDGRVTRLDLDANSRGGLQGGGSGNTLIGSIPDELGQLTKLTELYLGSNSLSGPIPPALGNLVNLTWLSLSNNRLSGFIPPALGTLVNLQRLQLGRNQLSGPIPAELGGLTNLVSLNLSFNQLNGALPEELGALTNLSFLNVQSNQLSGPIPAALGNLADLRTMALDRNHLSGPIPAELGDLVNLGKLQLDWNNLTGPIPAELGSLVRLTHLNLRYNELTGPIPPELGNLSRLTQLLLGDNPLTGTVPESLTQLSLRTFWIDATGVCVPVGAGFQAWVATIEEFRGDTCSGSGGGSLWTDHRIVPGVTPVRAVHLMELRSQVDAARVRCGLGDVAWIDPEIRPGVTPIKAVHITQLRAAIDAANQACSRMRPAWTDPQIVPGVTPVRAVHFAELRDAVLGLNDAPGANQAPELVGTIPIQTLYLMAGGNARRVDVAPYFRDPDDDPLTYSAVSANPGTVAANTSGSAVTLTPVAAGTTTVGVTASDGSLSAMQTISVTVDPGVPEEDPPDVPPNRPTDPLEPDDCIQQVDSRFLRGFLDEPRADVQFENSCDYDVGVYIKGFLFDTTGQLLGWWGARSGVVLLPVLRRSRSWLWRGSGQPFGNSQSAIVEYSGQFRVLWTWTVCLLGGACQEPPDPTF